MTTIRVHNILETDHVYYKTSEEKCSRCRRELRDNEVPLRFWPQVDPNYMLIYCNDCIEGVLTPGKEDD